MRTRSLPKVEKITIRPVVGKDAPAIAGIIRRLGWFEHLANLSQEEHALQVAQAMAVFRESAYQTAWVAVLETEEVVGYTSVHWRSSFFLPQGEGYLAELFVDARHRSRNIGARLMAAVLREARQRGCARLVVTQNRHRESYQRGFYRCRGWRERPEMAQLIYPLWSAVD
jgi:GNAT superfamily N-acetyltransferase